VGAISAKASLSTYDAAIISDAAGGLAPLARLTSAVVLTGTNRAAFNFGASSGSTTFEFVLEGDPAVVISAFLAVGENSSSSLRYDIWYDTGELGFTEGGVADYQFSPGVPSPVLPTHIAYVWDHNTRTMKLFLNGKLAGSRAGVSTSFAMPRGQGWLGANTSGSEAMVGTIHRLVVYAGMVSEEVIRAHADTFNDVLRPPSIQAFAATPDAIFTPQTSTLAWSVQNATAVFLDGANVSGRSNQVVSPLETTTYHLVASNASASASAELTVRVNPAPIIETFASSRRYCRAGETLTLSWQTRFAQVLSVSPGVGNVTVQTVQGSGTVDVKPAASTTYELKAESPFGTNTATVAVHLVQPANHLVISEFMADDESTCADEEGEFSGWIEIHNPTGNPVDLAGYFLTDDAARPLGWGFPSTNIAAGGYILVFASGKNRAVAGRPLHTHFKLNNSGEYLALVGPGPTTLHAFAPTFPPQRPDIAYGILSGDPTLVQPLAVATPGLPNNEALPPPEPVRFSRLAGFFTQPFTVSLSAADPTAEIFFTVDGSSPKTMSTRYGTPIPIAATTRLRAVAKVGGLFSKTSGEHYIRLAPDLASYTSSLPIMVVENFGAGTIQRKGWNSTGAGLKQVPRQPAAWATFERVGSSSALTNPPDMFSLVGIRGRGAYSTEWRQKPYSVEAMDEEGDERKVSPLGLPQHADWVLYFPDAEASKDPTLLFNTFAYQLSSGMGRYAARFRWVEAFINEDGGDLSLADRRGVYAVLEKVARGNERLDFQKLSPDGLTGGWLLNINRMDPEPDTGWPAPNGAMQPWFLHTAGPDRVSQTQPNTAYGSVPGDDLPQQWNAFINFDNPNGFLINTNQRAAIEGWFKRFENVLYDEANWRHPTNGYLRYLDAQDFADYFIINVLTRNGDGLLLSMFPWKGDDDKLRMGPAWDYNWSAYYVSGGPTGSLWHRSDQLWYPRLFADLDFVQLYIDRWWDARRGAMSNSGMRSVIDGQAAEITAEKALLNGMPSAAEWTVRLDQMKTWLAQRADWIDSNYLRPPVFSHSGGEVPLGFSVSLSGTNGTIYVTTDGMDPRAPGGAVAGSARSYAGSFALSAPTVVKARIRNGAKWSGLTAATFTTPQDLSRLALTEIMYDPPAAGMWAGEDFEFLELKNTGTNMLNLGTLRFAAGIEFTFTNNTEIGPGQFLVLARNALAFQGAHPGVSLRGLYSGKLNNTGETLRLALASGATVWEVTFNNRAPWPLAPAGFGYSAVPRDPSGPNNLDDGTRWRASSLRGGSPGFDDPPASIAPVFINEVLTRATPSEMDAIELFNPNSQPITIGGWFLTDDGGAPKKFQIPPDTTLNPGAYRVFTALDFNPTPGTLANFTLDAAGDTVYLVSADTAGNLTGYSHDASLGAAAPGVSFGRHTNSLGIESFPAQMTSTIGGANTGPRVGPVVITEIMYHPQTNSAEYIELRNLTATNVPLFNPAEPGITWRLQGLGFSFSTNTVVPPYGLVLLAAMDSASLRAQHAIPDDVPVFGPTEGTLQDTGERLELVRPDFTEPGQVLYVVVDAVRYEHQSPWPAEADGGGYALHRKNFAAYGDDPGNWVAALPSPGVDYVADDDHDGLPDEWESAYGLSSANPQDRGWDADGDGMVNWQEFASGTNPTNATSYLKIDFASVTETGTFLTFRAASKRAYSIEYRDRLETGGWSSLTNVPAAVSDRDETVHDPATRLSRFYRLILR
jgi:hypothetical protein